MRQLARYALAYDAGMLTGFLLVLAYRDMRRGRSPQPKETR